MTEARVAEVVPRPDWTTDLDVIAQAVPLCLRLLPQWVCWKYIRRKGKWTKQPIDPKTGGSADSTDPTSWGTFDQACDCYRRSRGLAGVGFVFSASDPYCGVDLDDAIDLATGQLKQWAQRLVALLNSYTELSPSRRGVKVFCQARKPGTNCRKAYSDGEVEIYNRDRFFVVTGLRLAECSPQVEPRQAKVDEVYREVFAPKPNAPTPTRPPPSSNGSLEDDEVVRLASNSRKNGAKFSALWSGNWQDHFRSPSEADGSLVFRLAFYTKDGDQLDRIFRRSGLMRDKWDERHSGDGRTYGRKIIDDALANVTAQYAPSKRRTRSRGAVRSSMPTGAAGALPAIIVTDKQLSDLTTEALAALDRANDPPIVFVRSGALVRVMRDEKGIPRIEPFDKITMRCRLTDASDFFSERQSHDAVRLVGIHPPLALAENILALGHWRLPALAGIARAPILRPDGSICMTPGYDRRSELIYCPDPGLVLPDIPEFPSVNEVQACAAMLMDLISDFPFVDEAGQANILALLLSILMRPVISGHIPLAIIDAPLQGTGKTLLVSVLVTIAVGTIAVESVPAKQNDDEWRKKITSILLGAAPFVLLDNIPDNSTIDSPALAAVLTTHEWSDRLLGKNESLRLPARAVWAATGNNLRVAGDMPRRTYSVRLDANTERPWERTGFKIPDVERYVRERRGDLLAAAFTIIRGWFAHDCPRASVPVFGSFDEWAGTIGSVLAYAGIHGFLGNLSHTRAVQDEDMRQWSAFFDAWWNVFDTRVVTVDGLLKRIPPQVMPDALLAQRDRGEGSLRRSLGHHLRRLAERMFEGRKLRDVGEDTHTKVREWRLVHVGGPDGTSTSPTSPHIPADIPAEEGEA